MIETALSAALVGLVVIAAAHSLGGSVTQIVNTATRAINPSLFTGPEAAYGGPELSVVAVGPVGSSRTGAVVKRPPSRKGRTEKSE